MEHGGEWAALLVLGTFAIPLTVIDIRSHRLPNSLTASLFVAVAAVLAVTTLVDPEGHPVPGLVRAAIGALVYVGVTLLIHLLSPPALGLGDVKLAASLGLVLAWFSWNALLVGILAGFILAGLAAALLLLLRRVERRGEIAMGPYLIAGTLMTMLASLLG